ncbi:MAG: type II secretion system F family protein, partial [Deltaproteobacteria bacterium]|nr:type II secretion system F family protein [Deltaproteobacteria bacterium]
MKKYSYKAINENGETLAGYVEADSQEAATNILNARGFIPTMVTGAVDASERFGLERINEMLTPVKAPELIIFSKQFRTMLRSGVPINKLLEILENQTENPVLKKTIASMSNDIKEGASLYNVFRKHPKVFSPLYCSMVRAGEASGALPEVLDRLSYILEHEHKVKSDVKSALQYPMIVIVFLGIAFFILLTFVIPKFVGIFLNAGIDLPLPTKICMVMYQFLSDYWVFIALAVITGTSTLIYYVRTEPGKYVRDVFLMRLPIIGKLFIKAAMSRFASIFSILQSSGVDILDSMKILSGTIGNAAIAREFENITNRLEEGRGIAEPLKES